MDTAMANDIPNVNYNDFWYAGRTLIIQSRRLVSGTSWVSSTIFFIIITLMTFPKLPSTIMDVYVKNCVHLLCLVLVFICFQVYWPLANAFLEYYFREFIQEYDVAFPMKAALLIPILIITRIIIYNIVCIINGFDWHYDTDPDIPQEQEDTTKTLDTVQSPRVYNFMASKDPKFKVPIFSDYQNFKDWRTQRPIYSVNEDLSSNASESSEDIHIGYNLRDKYKSIGLISTKSERLPIKPPEERSNYFQPIKGNRDNRVARLSSSPTIVPKHSQFRGVQSFDWSNEESNQSISEGQIVPKTDLPVYKCPPRRDSIIVGRCLHGMASGDVSSFSGENHIIGERERNNDLSHVAGDSLSHTNNKFTGSIKRMKLEEDNNIIGYDTYSMPELYDSNQENSVLSLFNDSYDNTSPEVNNSQVSKKKYRTKTIQFQVNYDANKDKLYKDSAQDIQTLKPICRNTEKDRDTKSNMKYDRHKNKIESDLSTDYKEFRNNIRKILDGTKNRHASCNSIHSGTSCKISSIQKQKKKKKLSFSTKDCKSKSSSKSRKSADFEDVRGARKKSTKGHSVAFSSQLPRTCGLNQPKQFEYSAAVCSSVDDQKEVSVPPKKPPRLNRSNLETLFSKQNTSQNNTPSSSTSPNELSPQPPIPLNDGRRIIPRNGPPSSTNCVGNMDQANREIPTRVITSLTRQSTQTDNRVPLVVNRVQVSSLPILTNTFAKTPSPVAVKRDSPTSPDCVNTIPLRIVNEAAPNLQTNRVVQAFPVTQVIRSGTGHTTNTMFSTPQSKSTVAHKRIDGSKPYQTNNVTRVRPQECDNKVYVKHNASLMSCAVPPTQNQDLPLAEHSKMTKMTSDLADSSTKLQTFTSDVDTTSEPFLTPSTSVSGMPMTSRPFDLRDDVTSESRVRRLQQLVSLQSLCFKNSNSDLEETGQNNARHTGNALTSNQRINERL